MFTHGLTVFITAHDDFTREHWAREFARKLVNITGGFTRTETQGGWVDENGTLVVEASTRLEFLVTEDLLPQLELEAQGLIDEYVVDANQEAALYTVEEIKGHLIFSK